MKISILCTDPNHPVVSYLKQWQREIIRKGHATLIYFDKKDLIGGDILFLVSCSQIITEREHKLFGAILVLHASDLPAGRGWSPHIWAILAGEEKIVVSLIEATDPIDCGDIWLQTSFRLEGHELLPEINELLFSKELDLMTEAVDKFDQIEPKRQIGEPGQYLRLRTPEDSELDPNRSIGDQFDLLRIADYERHPAYFRYRGKSYILRIEKVKDADE